MLKRHRNSHRGIAGALTRSSRSRRPRSRSGSPRGDNMGDYNITKSFEIGYRWRLVGGNLGEYRSDVNYGNGLRLLGSSFSVNSKDGHGTLLRRDPAQHHSGSATIRTNPPPCASRRTASTATT